MALIQCPECEQSISDKALKCPKCGYPIREYLEEKETKKEGMGEVVNESKQQEQVEEIVQQPESPNTSNKKVPKGIVIIGIIVVLVIGIIGGMKVFNTSVSVKDISIDKWRLTDSSTYGDYYEGTVTSEQKNPFIAVIGRFEENDSYPEFVYVEDGVGTLETYESSDEDPSIKYRAIGYLSGKQIDESDMKVKITDGEYTDWTYSDTSNCDVQIDIEINNGKNGILVFDIVNESYNDTEKNMIVAVVNGKAEYFYYANIPYKSRGIEISIVPKMFCESKSLAENDYTVEKEYYAEKGTSKYSTSYSGSKEYSFEGYTNGIVVYTSELKEGGSLKNRNVVSFKTELLYNEKCTISTYDYGDSDEKMLMPNYEFKIIGVINWIELEKETI